MTELSGLPSIPLSEFAERLRLFAPELPAAAVEALHRHYEELRRWNERLSLVGPGTATAIVERHYGESLMALEMLGVGSESRELLDVGSGGGFPGLVLAVARPTLRVTLLESRQRKASFLRRSAHLSGAEVTVVEEFLDEKLSDAVPEQLDFVTLRAVKLEAAAWRALGSRLAPEGLVLQWSGPESPAPAVGFERVAGVRLPGSDRRSIQAWAATSGQRRHPRGGA